MSILLPSKGEINRCGEFLAARVRHPPPLLQVQSEEEEALEHAIKVVSDFRAAHQYPLTKVTMGLRSMLNSEGARIVVSQRLKRLPRIVRKLVRMDGSNLARLEDIGGCRAVLEGRDELQRVLRRLRHRWGSQVVRERDYVTDPKEMGYRAIHLVVQRDERRIEVQLRTESQQRWADAVEKADARLKLNLKDGSGPAEMVEFFTAAAEVQHGYDYDMVVPDEALARLQAAREAVIRAGYYRR